MFEIKAIVRLDRQEDVIAALHAVPDLPGVTVSVVEGVGRRHADPLVESGDYGRIAMAKIEIVVAEDRLRLHPRAGGAVEGRQPVPEGHFPVGRFVFADGHCHQGGLQLKYHER